ncbi:O-antigen ligase family protein [Neptuniibacter caesariensis]|uniref:Secreted polysaccharide polymerase n=1 Tax=Neptuniibacter caesariensis TaxID=207954 RepID=A0A7U8GT82_NEPCE|nr:O-antigen ligase family protein [Neptuniibacter caesariensis]EAR62017.1 secreted polysaccharide polymerase [Oceanospirillum sp. MED92] [Neptuniibacter caesariensis]
MLNARFIFQKHNDRPNSRLLGVLLALFACALICGLWLLVPHPLLPIVMALVPLGLLFVLKNPFPIILGFVIISFFRIHEVIPQLYTLRIPLMLAMGALVSLSWGLWAGIIRPFWTKELAIFSAFFVQTTVSVVMASDRAASFAYFTSTYIKIAIMVFAITWLCANIDRLRFASNAFVVSGITVAFVALFNKANGIGLVEGTRVTIGRDLGSTLGDPNDLSLVLLFPAGFALSIALNPGSARFIRILGLLTFLLMGAAIVATQSRGGLLGITAVAGIFAYRRIKSKALLGLIGTVCLGALFVLAGISDRQSGGAHEEGIDESAMGRIHAWVAAFRMALHNPVTGVGLDNFLLNYFTYSDFWDGQNHAVHSTWFGVLGETGFSGAIIFITMVVMIFKVVLRALQTLKGPFYTGDQGIKIQGVIVAEGILGALTGFCISGTFLTMGFMWPIYILLSLATALGVVVSREHRHAQVKNNNPDSNK